MVDPVRKWLQRFVRVRSWRPELVLFVVALVLSVAARQAEPFPLDLPLGEVVQSWQLPLLDPVLRAVSAIGWFRVAAPTTIAVVLVLVILGLRAQAFALAAAALSGLRLDETRFQGL